MSAYLCQPYFSGCQLRFYKTDGAVSTLPYHTVDLKPDRDRVWPGSTGGPNAVIAYNGKLFVSFDCDNGKGGVLVYEFSDVYPTRTAALPLTLLPQDQEVGLPSVGMAIEPISGDLYVATHRLGVGGDSGVYKFTSASGYTVGTQFASFFNDTSVAEVCANLAFDGRGNLWMTTWSPNNVPKQHFLICYKSLNKSTFYKITNDDAKIYLATNKNGTSVNVHLLSAPEGIAFDSQGNLWLANNNDWTLTNNAGEGTLVKIRKSFIDGLLISVPSPETIVPVGDADVKLIDSAKLGGVEFDADTIFINDQGQNQGSDPFTSGAIWKWDTLSAFDSMNFNESGIHTTYPGNGSGALLWPRLLIRDSGTTTNEDVGLEPNTITKDLWICEDISIDPLDPLSGSSCNVTVRVKNIGMTPTASDDRLLLYWAKASTGLGWPDPWNGTMIGALEMGKKIGEQSLGVILPGVSTSINFPWTAPVRSNYTPLFGPIEDGHFCLLARIESAARKPFGMTYPELEGNLSDLAQNVRNNSRIGWRNIGISNLNMAVSPPAFIQGIIVANYSPNKVTATVKLDFYNANGLPTIFEGTIRIKANGRSTEILRRATAASDGLSQQSRESFLLSARKTEISLISLGPGEILPLVVELSPADLTSPITMTARQYTHEPSGLVLVGGQTFLCGTGAVLPA